MAVRGNYFARIENSNSYFAGRSRGVAPEREYQRAVDAFSAKLPKGGSVLGVGSGDGRHLAVFKERGYTVLGVEPSPAFRAAAVARGIPTIDGTFENLATRSLPLVDGVWCGAALRHVPEDYVVRALRNLAHILPGGGVIFFAVELGEGSEWACHDGNGSSAELLNQQFTEAFLEICLTQQGFVVSETWRPEPTEGRKGQWIAVIAQKK